MTDLVLVHGTWGRGQAWHQPEAPLPIALMQLGLTVHDFLWSGRARWRTRAADHA